MQQTLGGDLKIRQPPQGTAAHQTPHTPTVKMPVLTDLSGSGESLQASLKTDV